MSTEPATAPAAAASNNNANDKGKGRAPPDETDADASDTNAQDQPTSGSNNKDGKQPAAAGENKENETPEALREQLEAVRRELRANLEKKQGIDRQLASHEAAIYAFETSYLALDLSANAGNATFGNIVRGYDSYLKPGGPANDTSNSRKKGGSSTRGGQIGYTTGIIGPGGSLLQPVTEEERLFSRSSGTYMDSVMLRDRDQGTVTASEDEDEDGEDAPGNKSAAATDAESSAPAGQRDAKRQKRSR